jgi:hypothetical protein
MACCVSSLNTRAARKEAAHFAHPYAAAVGSFCHLQSQQEDCSTARNIAEILVVGERCFEQKLYKATRILFNRISNFGNHTS